MIELFLTQHTLSPESLPSVNTYTHTHRALVGLHTNCSTLIIIKVKVLSSLPVWLICSHSPNDVIDGDY